MIEQISFALVSESGEIVRLKERQLESKIETAIADLFSEICRNNNNLADREIQESEKFHFAAALQNYLKEQKENVDRNTN